jgi:hypothetical protein
MFSSVVPDREVNRPSQVSVVSVNSTDPLETHADRRNSKELKAQQFGQKVIASLHQFGQKVASLTPAPVASCCSAIFSQRKRADFLFCILLQL